MITFQSTTVPVFVKETSTTVSEERFNGTPTTIPVLGLHACLVALFRV